MGLSGLHSDTIAAVATGRGGAIAVVRISGGDAVAVADRVFVARNGRPLSEAAGYTVHFGEIRDPDSSLSSRAGGGEGGFPVVDEGIGGSGSSVAGEGGDESVDEVLVTVFRAPHSYTGEDSIEISCHASPYIENRIMQLLIAAGARAAEAGEFTVRAFLAGKLDLSEAEAVADLIASTDRAQHRVALAQMKGGVSSALAALRSELLELAALLELELDFSEEDVEFASRSRLAELARRIHREIDTLAGSFSLGNAIREGIPVAIVGKPNAGKSTLLNALVGDDRAMVSEIAGTTRDRIEERVNIGGVGFRFIDTAGLRATDDVLEQMGIDRTREAVRRARIVLLVVDGGVGEVNGIGGVSQGEPGCAELDFEADVEAQVAELELRGDQKLCVVVNKIDSITSDASLSYLAEDLPNFIAISAKSGENLDALTEWLAAAVDMGALEAGATVISNTRHYEALLLARKAVERVLEGLELARAVVVATADLLAEDIREVLHHLGAITGEVTTDEILGTIFSRFCIGK